MIDEEAGRRSWSQKFTLPLDLLTSRSPYFRSLFEGGFAESEQGYVKLRDVSPWVFRVFVGWLYYQTIFYEVEQKQPRAFTGKPSPPESKPQAVKSKGKSDAKKTGEKDGTTVDEAVILSDDEWDLTSIDDDAMQALSTVKPSASKKRKTAKKRASRTSDSSRHHPPGGNQNKFNQEDEVTWGESQTDDYECNYREPTTWPPGWLFELYVFADKYDVPDFRAGIFEAFQMQLYRGQPRRYLLPAGTDVAYIADNITTTSPLYRLLVDCWAVWLSLSQNHTDFESQATEFDGLPAHFLSRVLVAAKRCSAAKVCGKCKIDGSGEKCTATDHVKADRLVPPEKDICTYHEHKTDEEKARCALRWESRRHLL